MKRVLIIGSTSTVGLALGQALNSDAVVTFAGRRNADIQLDLGRDTPWEELQASYDVVVNVAAYFGSQQPSDMLEAARVNALGALQACVLAKQVEAKHIVQISSASAGYCVGSGFYNAYSLTKRQGEELCTLFCAKHELALTILRPTQLYDAMGAARIHQRMFYHILDRAAAGQDIVIFGRSDPWRNYIFIPDFAEICRRVILRGVTGIFNVAHPDAHRLSKVAALAYDVFGTTGTIGFDCSKPDLGDVEVEMDRRLIEAITYVPETSLINGMRLFRLKQESES